MSYKPFFNRYITATLAVPFLFIFAPDFISARGAEVAQTRIFSVSRAGVESSPLVVVGGEGLTGTSFSLFDPAVPKRFMCVRVEANPGSTTGG